MFAKFWPPQFDFGTLLGVISIALIIVCLRRFVRKQNQIREKFSHLPCIKSTSMFGNLLGMVATYWLSDTKLDATVFFANIALSIANWAHQNKEGLFYFRIGPFRHFVVLLDAKTAEATLSSNRNIEKAPEYNFLKPWLGNGLLTAGGQHWKRNRKLLTPTFNLQILNKFIPAMNSQLGTFLSIIDRLAERKDKTTGDKDDKTSIIIDDIRPMITNCTLDIICQTAMGTEMNAQNEWWRMIETNGANESPQPPPESHQYPEALRKFLDTVLTRLTSPWLHPEITFPLFPLAKKMRSHVRVMHQFSSNVISKRKAELIDKLNYSTETDIRSIDFDAALERIVAGKRREIDFLDLLLLLHLQDEKQFNLTNLREQVDTFMFGGHDTTASALQFALLLIGLNPDKQELIHNELDCIFGDEDSERDITAKDIKRMTYLEMCIKESMRIYSPVAFFARTINEPFQCDKYHIPSGCTLLALTYAIHRDPTVYRKPEHFIPERFDSSSDKKNEYTLRNPYAFVPFSVGPRNCIGQRFAMMEMKLFLAHTLRRYQIRSLTQRDNILLDFAIIAQSNTPIKIQFRQRQR